MAKKAQGAAFNEPPVFASTFHYAGNLNSDEDKYGRLDNPTWRALEKELEVLEGGSTLIFPSGMAAVTAAMMPFLQSGDVLILPSDGYYSVRDYAERYLKAFCIEVRFVSTTEIPNQDLSDVRMICLESPSNPMLDMVDITSLAENCRSNDTLLVIDNSTVSPLAQQPLSLGADISVCSDSKVINGHSDVIFGHVASKNAELLEKLQHWRLSSGSIPGPMETWLVSRGLQTLSLRYQQMMSSAKILAEYFSSQSAIRMVRYPGLKDDPSFELASRQMNSPGFIITLDFGTEVLAKTFLDRCHLIAEATSFGGTHSIAERRARWGKDDISEGLVRVSVGCEATDDLLEDVRQAIEGLEALA